MMETNSWAQQVMVLAGQWACEFTTQFGMSLAQKLDSTKSNGEIPLIPLSVSKNCDWVVFV